MKSLKRMVYPLVFILFFLLGGWLLFPWQLLSDYVWVKVQRGVAQNGFFLTAQEGRITDPLIPTMSFKGLELTHAMLEMRVDRVRVRFLPISSLLNASLTVGMDLGKAEIKTLMGTSTGWDRGGLRLLVGAASTKLSGVDFKGDISIKGDLLFQDQKPVGGTLSLSVPSTLDAPLKLATGSLSYISSEEPGKWRIAFNAKSH